MKLNVKEAAAYLGFGRPTLHRLIKQDPTLPARVNGHFDSADLDAWVQAHRVEPGTLGYKYAEPRICRPRSVTPAEWFWVRVASTPEHGCWEWTQGVGKGRAYGQFFVSPGVKVYAHRFAYELLVGPIPDGLELDHLCRNQRCVRPSHLEPVTRSENQRRAWAAKRASDSLREQEVAAA